MNNEQGAGMVRTAGMAFLFMFFCLPPFLFAGNDEMSVYFNAATEKYLQGNFSEAVEDLEKAQLVEPANSRIKEFSVKILLEAATQNHMKRNYKQAFEFIKKAYAIDPENPGVKEMYRVTESLVNPKAEKAIPAQESAIQLPPAAPREAKKVVLRNVSRAEAAKPVERLTAPVTAPPQPRTSYALLWIALATMALSAGACAGLVSRLRKTKKQLQETEGTLALLKDDRERMHIEYEKAKEREKYEHQIAEQYHRDLKEKNKHEEERMRMELELRTRHIEEKVSADMMVKKNRKDPHHEAFLHQQQAKLIECLGDTSEMGDVPSPAIESMRERIALMAENLYEYAPGAAMDFMRTMVKNEHPLIRTNVVSALARIARQESIELLLELYSDNDYRVKREVLKHMKLLQQRISAAALILKPGVGERIAAVLQEEKTKGEWIF